MEQKVFNVKEFDVKKKVDDIDYSLRNNIIDLALDFMFNDKGAYLPSQRDISLLLSLIHNCFLITDEDNLEIDIFESNFSSDELYELAYLYDYKSDLPKRKLNAIEKDIDEIIRCKLLDMEIGLNRTSKYDDILDSILDFINKYKNVFSNIDINKYVKDISMLSKKMGNVKEEDVVKNIVKLMHDHPIEENDENKNDEELLKELIDKNVN